MAAEEWIAGESAIVPAPAPAGVRGGLVRRKLEASQEHIALSILSNHS